MNFLSQFSKNADSGSKSQINKVFMILALVLTLSLLLTACAQEEEMAEPDAVEETEDAGRDSTYADEKEMAEQSEVGETSEEDIKEETNQQLILNGTIDITVQDVDDIREEVNEYLDGIDGYIENSSFRTREDDIVVGDLTVRVPQDVFEDTMSFLEDLGEVDSRDTSSEDVTMEYVDLEARLNNLERQEERYLEILDEAEDIDDVLSVEEELTRVREEIETLTARLESLQNQISYSTIDIQITEEEAVEAQVEAEGLEGLWERMSAAFTGSIDGVITGVTNLLVFLSGAFPYLVVLGILGIVGHKLGIPWKSIIKKPSKDENH